jgi:adenylate cyclase, class 2
MTGIHREIEIKLALKDARSGRLLLRTAGYRVSARRVLEQNAAYDFPDGRLRAAETLLRLRTAGKAATLTFKGPQAGGKHKSREEIESTIPDVAPLAAIFAGIGLQPVFRYEKYRTEYRAGSEGVAMLDETPIGVFLELEGTPSWIDGAARDLGFTEAAYITASYATLFWEWKARSNSPAEHMTFAAKT